MAASLLLLAACQRDDSSAVPADKAASMPLTTITALIWAPDWPDEMDKVAAAFTRLNPDIKVNVQFMIGNSVEENIQPKLASRKLPDLMSVNPNPYAAALAERGVLTDVGHTAAWARLLPSLKPDWMTQDGKRFGIAGGVAATVMYYNKRMFAQAGVTRLPTNFSEFLDVCERLKKAGFTPIVWNGGFPNVLGNGPFSFGFANNVVARTPDWKARIAAGTLNLSNAAGADIFAKIKLVAQRGYVQPGFMGTGYDEGITMFTEGKAAMAFQGTWAAGRMMHGQGFETGVFLPPWNDAGAAAVPVIGSETGFAVCETPNKEAAIRFLEFIMGEGFPIQQERRQNIAPFATAGGAPAGDPQIVAYLDAVNRAPVTGSPYYSMLPAATIDLLHPLMQDVLVGKVTPQQAAHRLDASIRDEAKKNHK
ncbi:MAG: extracellular solute-binding protein family 1 [Massilia sp.]|jgi:multiple sugar transport system substrate-binding protein|nr:extracellular solute-binding protein family 1 [Massilia sp.]